MNDLLERRIRAYLEQIDPAIAGEHGHNQTLWAASVLVWGFALSEAEAWPFALEYNARCLPPWNEHGLRRKLNQALLKPCEKPRGYLLDKDLSDQPCALPQPLPRPPKPEYQPEKLTSVASRISDNITPKYLEARSKFTCWNRSPAGFLHKLYKPGEKVVVFNVFESQGCEIWEHHGLVQNLATLNWLQKGQDAGVWFTANPVDGRYHWNPREGHESRRSEECVTAWRYSVLESDKAPKELWLKALVQIPLPISAIYESGGSSVHALVRIDATSKADWDEIVREWLLPMLVPLGADGAAMTGVRLTRLPNCRREKTRSLQRLLYLTDNPASGPICEIPPREMWWSKQTQVKALSLNKPLPARHQDMSRADELEFGYDR
jgi:hypothetical protein